MGDLRRVNFSAALEQLEAAHNRERKANSELRLRAARAEAWLDRIFKAEDVDAILETIRRAEDDLRVGVRS